MGQPSPGKSLMLQTLGGNEHHRGRSGKPHYRAGDHKESHSLCCIKFAEARTAARIGIAKKF